MLIPLQIMNNKVVVVPLGVSGSGKDTLCDVFGGEKIHPISDMKRFWEAHYGHPVGSFDEAEYKEEPLSETSNVTIGEFQINLYHFMKAQDPETSLYGLRRHLNYALRGNTTFICITGVRSLPEAYEISEFLYKHQLPLMLIKVTRPGYEPKGSDTYIDAVHNVLSNVSTPVTDTCIVNDMSKEVFVFDCQLLVAEARMKYVNSKIQ